VIELPEHPYFVASQYHPEFKSRPNRPQPLFREFVGAALARARDRGTAAPAETRTVDGELQRLAEPAADGDAAGRAAHDPAQRGNW
jgi:Glutamine amidotransferase class-I